MPKLSSGRLALLLAVLGVATSGCHAEEASGQVHVTKHLNQLSEHSCFAAPFEPSSNGGASATVIDRDAFLLGGHVTEAQSAEMVVALTSHFRRVCVNDVKPFDDGMRQRIMAAAAANPSGDLSRLYLGGMGMPAEALGNLSSSEIFVIAPNVDWSTGSLPNDLRALTGLDSFVYVMLEDFPFVTEPFLELVAQDFVVQTLAQGEPPLRVQLQRLSRTLQLGTNYHPISVVFELERRRSEACPSSMP